MGCTGSKEQSADSNSDQKNINNNNNNNNSIDEAKNTRTVMKPEKETSEPLHFRDPSISLQQLFIDKSKQNATAANNKTAMAKDKETLTTTTTTATTTTNITKESTHHVRNVFAVPLGTLKLTSYAPPVYHKTDYEKEFILAALKNNFVFENLSSRELYPLVLAFEKTIVPAGQVVIRQGDEGDYFYVIQKGACTFHVDGKHVGTAKQGNSFGELALLYTCPRAATVTASTEAVLFRVEQTAFRFILQNQTQKGNEDKSKLLAGVSFLKDLGDLELSKLSRVMTPKRFSKGDFLMRKGDSADYFYILQEGSVQVTDISVADAKYEDVSLKAGDYFGERALVTGEPRNANVIATADGLAFCIDKTTFETVLGSLNDLILRSQDKRTLTAIKVFVDSKLDSQTLDSLAKLMVDKEFKADDFVVQEGESTEAALYIVRKGQVEIIHSDGTKSEHISSGGFFGDEQLLVDANAADGSTNKDTLTVPVYSAKVVEDCVCGVLSLAACRRVMDTRKLGKPVPRASDTIKASQDEMKQYTRHTILGAGTFGQVFLVSREENGKREPYALKVQSKYELCKDGQAKAVIYEKNIMAELQHPFLIHLVKTYQDETFVYMLLTLVQGGELYTVIHSKRSDGVPEKSACFYAACISEGLGFMHRRGYVYRDLKPENVLIDKRGYPVIVDFGFAKKVVDKTYTLCGTPLYLAPEVILSRGHNAAADHWSLGILIYEMITGVTPFYRRGMDQMDLFRAIVKAKFDLPNTGSTSAKSIIEGFLTKNPVQRLGSLAGGEDDVLEHPWFSDLEFEALRRGEVKAPFVPKIKDPLDASNFDDWSHLEDKTKMKFPDISPEQKELFTLF